jgi:hypothetical protein
VLRAALITMGLTASYDTVKEVCVERAILPEGDLLSLLFVRTSAFILVE